MITYICSVALLIVIASAIILIPLAKNSAWRSLAVSILAFPVIAITLYQHWGAGDLYLQWIDGPKQHVELQKQFQDLGSIEEITAKMRQRVAENPSDPQAWYLLSRLYTIQNDTDSAKQAMQQAQNLKSGKRS